MNRHGRTRVLNSIRSASHVEFTIHRSLGVRRIGSNTRPKFPSEWLTQIRLVKQLNNDKCHCDTLLVSDDGNLLVVVDTFNSTCSLYDNRRQILARNDVLRLKEGFTMTQALMVGNKITALCTGAVDNSKRSFIQEWDLREPQQTPAVSYMLDKHTQDSAGVVHYSRKEDRFLVHNTAPCDGFSILTRDGVNQFNNSEVAPNWVRSVKNVSLSKDGNTLVMETGRNYFIIIRDLNLDTLFHDLKYFQPFGDESGSRDGSRPYPNRRRWSSRNVPELMYYPMNPRSSKCFCTDCNRSAIISEDNDFILSYTKYDIQKGYPRCTVPWRNLKLFDIKQRQRVPHQQLDSPGTKVYTNTSTVTVFMQDEEHRPGDIRIGNPPQSPPRNPVECQVKPWKVAVANLQGQSFVAVSDHLENHVTFVILNDDFIPEYRNLLHSSHSITGITFSPISSSFIVMNREKEMRWYDIERLGPVPDDCSVPNKRRIFNPFPFSSVPSGVVDVL